MVLRCAPSRRGCCSKGYGRESASVQAGDVGGATAMATISHESADRTWCGSGPTPSLVEHTSGEVLVAIPVVL